MFTRYHYLFKEDSEVGLSAGHVAHSLTDFYFFSCQIFNVGVKILLGVKFRRIEIYCVLKYAIQVTELLSGKINSVCATDMFSFVL